MFALLCIFSYEILIENLMDPSHVPYAHYGIMQTSRPKSKLFWIA